MTKDLSHLIRLSKIMAQRGLCSRREADEYISRGLVKVDGEIVDQLGTKVNEKAYIELLSEAQQKQDDKVTIILNKPLGFVSNQPEKNYQPAITLIKPENQDPKDKKKLKPHHLKKLAVAGRLDINSTGLLVLTQDGQMAKKLIGQDSNIEKEYIVYVEGIITQKKLNLLSHGLKLDDKSLKPARVKEIKKQTLQFILREGKKRQIRRMCELVDLKVTSLKRVRIGNIQLGNLKKGQWKFL